jgi:hypothetical protein
MPNDNQTDKATADSPAAHGSVSRTPAVIRALCDEHTAVENLMAIVEGCLGERWTSKGRRLVDTPEWCKLYTARCHVNDTDARAKMMTPND